MTARARLHPLFPDLTLPDNPIAALAENSWFRIALTYHADGTVFPWQTLWGAPMSDATILQSPGASSYAKNGAASMTTSVGATGNPVIDGVLSGVRWSDPSITYSDTDSPSDYSSGYIADDDADGVSAQFQDFSQLTDAQRLAFHAVLDTTVYSQPAGAAGLSVEGFTKLNISYAGPGAGGATIRAANSGDAATAYAYYPDTDKHGGDVFFGNAYDGTSNSFKNPIAGNYAWHGVLHELGHTLGLKHGHEAGGPGATALPAAYNSLEFSVMTYPSYIGDTTYGYDYEPFGAPQTFMMVDILALQTMYGADFTTNGGNTTYSWDPSSGKFYVDGVLAIAPGANRIFSTIWDGNGVDTYDLSNYTTALRINLNPGESSTFSAAQLAYLGGGPNDGFARGNVFNAFQFEGDPRSLIENANGGSNSDTMIGNTIANVLRGNGGNDNIDGGAGNDTLYGGDGDDLIQGGAGNDSAYGNNGIDRINGGNGNDLISGAGGNDILTGGAGTDAFLFNTALDKAANLDRITDFSVPNDTIQLEDAIFTALGSAGVLAASAFRANTSGLAADASDRIIYETDAGRLFYDSNGNESGGRTQFASLSSGLQITHLDFLVI